MKGGHGPTKWLSDSDCGAFDHASHAPQSLSVNYYIILSNTWHAWNNTHSAIRIAHRSITLCDTAY